MNSPRLLGLASSALLALFLVLNPVASRWGSPDSIETRGVARRAETGSGTGAGQDDPSTSNLGRAASDAAVVESSPSIAAAVVRLTSEARADSGLAPVQPEPILARVADRHSRDMLATGFFDHLDPSGRGPQDRVSNEHRRLVGTVLENIGTISGAGGASDSDEQVARRLVDGWLASPPHAATIFSDSVTHLGVGVAVRGDDVMATQVFAHVRGLLDGDVPTSVRRGDRLTLSIAGATAYDFYSPETGASSATYNLPRPQPVDTEPGLYRLRLHFPAGSFVLLVYGPGVEVR